MFDKLKEQVKILKRESIVIYFALLDEKTPFFAKIFAAITVAYLLSPIDLIPDFIPIFGLLDDLILIPILVKITISFIPINLLNEIREKCINEKLQKKWYFAIPILFIYILILILLYLKLFKK